MAKFQSPLLGYNNNVRHKNRVFHIQTEDSGVKHPHIITHLFMDGGRILKSVKTSYADHLGEEGMSDTVKQMMKAQHKAMFIALRDGQFDHLVDPGAAPSAPQIPQPPISEPEPPVHVHANTVPAPPPSSAADVNPPPPPPRMRPAAATIPDDPPSSIPPQTTREELTLDFAALERAARVAPAGPPPSGRDLPPPPPNLMRRLEPQKTPDPGTGRYRTLKREEPESEPAMRVPTPQPAQKPPSQRPRKGATPKPPKPKSERPPAAQPHDPGQGRYAPSRPAAIFGQARPQQSSIFGEELISDKSLDEVILSYLAEDLSGDAKK